MRILIAIAVLLMAASPAMAQGKGKGKGRPACEALKTFDTCSSRADCTWVTLEGKCRKLKAQPR